jgi:integrase
MASISRRGTSWRARYREWPGGPQRSRAFARKVDAERWLVEVQHQLVTGRYVDPSAGRITVADYAASWLARRTWRPLTRDRVEGELRRFILPQFGAWPIGTVRRAHVEAWANGLPLAPSSVRIVAGTFRSMLSAAVEDELLARNPASRAHLPAREHAPVVPLTTEQVLAIARSAPEWLRSGVVLAAGTGLRQGEAMAVTMDRVDFLRRELRVDRQLSTRAGGAVFAPPKSRRGYRTIALSGVVLDALSAHVAAFGAGDEGLVFHDQRGRPIVRSRLTTAMKATTAAVGIDATWHDLRHHHASVLLSAGVSPALVAERLGHDIKTLLDTYAHVIRTDEDRVRAIVDDALAGSAEAILRPQSPLITPSHSR